MRGGRSPLGFLSGGIIGHYRTVAYSGLTTGIAANAALLSFRNSGGASSYVRILLQRLRMVAITTVGFTGAQELSCAAYVARSFTGDMGGGTALTLTGNNAQLNSIADTTSIASIRVASTTALTGGTFTLDAQPFTILGATAAAAGVASASNEYVLQSDQQYPLNLQSASLWQTVGNAVGPEGIIVRNSVLQGAGGTVRYAFEIEWIEYDPTTNLGQAW
jgi:hypothetical protein